MKFRKVLDTRTGIEYDWLMVLESEEAVISLHSKSDPAKIKRAWDNIIETLNGKSHIHTVLGRIIWAHHELGCTLRPWQTETPKSVLQVTQLLLDKIISGKIACIKNYGCIYQNKFGGYFPHSEDIKILKECDIVGILYPDYSKKDIVVKQWENGSHWYAYIGEIWVQDIKGEKKFNSEKRAREVAEWYLLNINNFIYEFKN